MYLSASAKSCSDLVRGVMAALSEEAARGSRAKVTATPCQPAVSLSGAWCERVAPALLRCCYGIASLLIPCTSLVQPLYNRCTSLVPRLGRASLSLIRALAIHGAY